MKRLFFGVTVAIFCTFASFLVTVCLPDDRAARLEEAKQALDSRQNQKAYDTMSRLLREHPEDETVNFYMGRAAHRTGKLSHSAMAYERVLMINPDNHVAKAQLARTYLDMEQYALAEENFRAVLAHEPPPHVRDDIEQLLARTKTATQVWSAWGRVDIGGFYDNNVNFGPSSDIIDTSVGQLELDSKSLPKEAFGLSLTLTANGLYDIGEKGGWMVAGDAGLYGTVLDNANDRELLLLRGGLGLQHTGKRTFLQLPVSFQHLDKGHDSYVNISGFRPTILFGISPEWHLVSVGTVEYRNYTELNDRDGYYLAFEETLRRYFGKQRHSVALTLLGFHEDAKTSEHVNTGWESALSCELRLPGRVSPYGRARYRGSYYKGKSALEKEDRRDHQWQFLVGINKVLIRNWGVDLNYTYSNSSSTYDLYDYDKSVIMLSSFLTF